MFTQREKLILQVTATVFVGAMVLRWMVGPLMDRNSRLDAEISMARKKIARYQRLLSQKVSLEQAYGKIFSGRGPAGCEAARSQSFLAGLDTLAGASGVRVFDVRPQNGADDASGGSEAFDIRAEGSLTGIMKFVGEIERSAEISGIKRLQVNIRSNADMLEASMTVIQSYGDAPKAG